MTTTCPTSNPLTDAQLIDLRERFCGLNADWSVDAWHYGPGDRPNIVSGDLYVYDNELEEPVFTVAVVHYNEWTGDTIITPAGDHRSLSDAHSAALAMVESFMSRRRDTPPPVRFTHRIS